MARDYYTILGVADTATAEQIQDAYRRLARLYHPDVSGADTVDAFREVLEAWQTLGDAERRRAYDAQAHLIPRATATRRRRGVEPTRQRARAAGPRPGGDAELHLELYLSPAEAAHGGRTTVELPAAVRCGTCAGSGRLLSFVCPDCLGRGGGIAGRAFELDVPGGLRNGEVVRLSLEGLGLLHRNLVLHVCVSVG